MHHRSDIGYESYHRAAEPLRLFLSKLPEARKDSSHPLGVASDAIK